MGAEKSDGPKLTGIARIFNSETNFGRANVSYSRPSGICSSSGAHTTPGLYKSTLAFQVAKATYAGLGLLILYLSLKPKKK